MSDLSCPGCGKILGSGPVSGDAVGTTAQRLQAMPVMPGYGGVRYLCIPCAQQACEHARALLRLTGGSKYLSIIGLVDRYPIEGDPCCKVKS